MGLEQGQVQQEGRQVKSTCEHVQRSIKRVQVQKKWNKVQKSVAFSSGIALFTLYIPVVPHKAVAEVSKIGNL